MSNNRLLIYGTGGHAKVVAAANNWYGMVQFTDDTREADPVSMYPPTVYDAFVAIGNNHDRAKVFDRLVSAGYRITNIIHSSAVIDRYKVELGIGIYIGPNAVVNPGTKINDGVIINTAATVDHDCNIGSFTHIAPGANLCGHVTTGSSCLLGAGCVIIPRVVLGSSVIVGAGGAVVTPSVPDGSKLLGVPARAQVSESG